MKKHFLDKRLERRDANSLVVKGLIHPETTIFANEDVLIEASAVDELLQALQLDQTIDLLKAWQVGAQANYIDPSAELLKAVVTPDVHKGAGIPIGTVLQTKGFVIPAAIGGDIGCGMRLHTTSWKVEEVLSKLDVLESAFRHAFFEGGRNIPMTHKQREALFLDGLEGLTEAVPRTQEGLWRQFHQHTHEFSAIEAHGSLEATDTAGLDDFMNEEGLTRDGQIGSIGGGNHFVEVQRVEKVLDAATAYRWGLKVGQVTVMVHSGSVAIGHLCAEQYLAFLKGNYPKGLKHPANKLYPLPVGTDMVFPNRRDVFWSSLYNATNFAFANRLFLALMALDVLESTLGERDSTLLHDAPHNFVWHLPTGYLHRKGACSAQLDEPVLVPGSMGSSSFILRGLGNAEALESASHGAGRRLSRGEALTVDNATFETFMHDFRVVTPVDFRRQDIRQRRDIVTRKLENIKAEAPYVYKDIGGVVATLLGAGIASPVAELRPIMTVKG